MAVLEIQRTINLWFGIAKFFTVEKTIDLEKMLDFL